MNVVFPGSFDPITNGHLDIITRCKKTFDKVWVAVLENPKKKSLIPLEKRVELIKSCAEVEVIPFNGLLSELTKKLKASAIIRSIRNGSDLDFEMPLAWNNHNLSGIETLFIPSNFPYINSTLVRDIMAHGGDISGLVPCNLVKELSEIKDGSTDN